MKHFLRKATSADSFNILSKPTEYNITYHIKHGDYVILGCVDCPLELESGLVRVSLNIGLQLEDFINKYSQLTDTQIHMLKHNLPEFMGWLDNSNYPKSTNYVHYSRIKSNSANQDIWPICNIIELESEKSIVQGILDLAFMAATTIIEIHNSCIPFAGSAHLLNLETREKLALVEDFLKYCKR